MLVFFGVWGHTYFGVQGAGWGTPLAAAYSVVSMTDYEYDLNVRLERRRVADCMCLVS